MVKVRASAPMPRVNSKKGQQAFSRRARRTTGSHWAGSSARPRANSVGEIRCQVTVGPGQECPPLLELGEGSLSVETAGDRDRHGPSVGGPRSSPCRGRSPPPGRWDTDRVTHGRAEIHELLVANDLRPSRALGQNFVADGNTVRRIVRLAGITPGRRVVEVGAGLGSLTLALAEAGASVTAVEVDRYVLPVLRSQVEPLGVRVVEGDALRLDWDELLVGPPPGGGPADDRPWALVANLPYNVAVPVVIRVLEEAPQVASLLVMVQREVGERLAARAGDEAYGAVSVKVAYWATAAVVGRVSASVFIPMPRVESVLVRLDRRPDRHGVGPGSPAYERLFAVVRAGFAHRRKMLRRSLEGLVAPGGVRGHGDPAHGPGRGAVARGVGAAGLMDAGPGPASVGGPGRADGATGERSGRCALDGPGRDGHRGAVGAGQADPRRCRSPGVRSDGYHLLRVRDGLDRSGRLPVDRCGEGPHRLDRSCRGRGGPGPGRPAPSATVPVGHDNLVTRALAAVGPDGPGRPGEADPGRRRARRRLCRCRRRPSVGGLLRSGGGRRPGRGRPLLPVRGPGVGGRHRRGGHPAALPGAALHAAARALRRGHRRRLPGLGRDGRRRRAARADGVRLQRPGGARPCASSPGWPGGGRSSSRPPAAGPGWPAAARPGSSRAVPTDRSWGADRPCVSEGNRRSWSRCEPSSRCRGDDRRVLIGGGTRCPTPARSPGAELLAGGPPLPAGGLQHLLVLLLAHALAPLLDLYRDLLQ